MKKTLFITVYLLLLSVFAVAQIDNANFIGDVRFSILPPSQFEQLNQGWVLMDGRNVEGSEFQRITGFDTIPDATNQFIRGMGGTFDNADGAKRGSNRTVGSNQTYSTAMPSNKFVTDTPSHTHPLNRFATAHIEGHKGGSGEEWSTPGLMKNTNIPKTDPHAHSHIISGGDQETRPTNIALYIYIKIN